MDTKTRLNLEKSIGSHTQWIAVHLKLFLDENKLLGKLTNGCWSNENGLFVGWVSYLPHNDPKEESLDLTITFYDSAKQDAGKLEVGIYWSDGEVIQFISEVDNIEMKNVVLHVDTIAEEMKIRLLVAMKEEIAIDHLPHYRAG